MKNRYMAWNWFRTADGNHFSVQIFRLGILDYLSRRSVYFGKVPFGQTKTVLPLTSQPNFPRFFVNGKQTVFHQGSSNHLKVHQKHFAQRRLWTPFFVFIKVVSCFWYVTRASCHTHEDHQWREIFGFRKYYQKVIHKIVSLVTAGSRSFSLSQTSMDDKGLPNVCLVPIPSSLQCLAS